MLWFLLGFLIAAIPAIWVSITYYRFIGFAAQTIYELQCKIDDLRSKNVI